MHARFFFALVMGAIVAPFSVSAQTWSFAYAGTIADLNDIHFVTATTGYVATSADVRKTIDAGTTWTAAGTVTGSFVGVYFLNKDTGWVVGASGDIRKTVNGGTVWTNQAANGGGTIGLREVSFANALQGIALRNTTNTSGNAVRTTNGGDTWTPVTIGTGDASLSGLFKAAFPTAAAGYVAGKIGVYKSTDQGASWTSASTGLPSGLLFRGLEFVAADTGYVAGDSGKVFKTVNGGTAWTQVLGDTPTLRGINFTDIDCVTSRLCYAAGFGNGTVSGLSGGHVYKTTDGGATWESNFTLGTSTFNAIGFPSATVGFVLGTGGTLRRADAAVAIAPLQAASGKDLNLIRAGNVWIARFALARSGTVRVSLTNIAGETVWSSEMQGSEGANAFQVPAPRSGVHVLNVLSAEGRRESLLLEASR